MLVQTVLTGSFYGPESAECSGLVFVSCIVLENMSIFSRCFKSIPHRSISRARLDRCGVAERGEWAPLNAPLQLRRSEQRGVQRRTD